MKFNPATASESLYQDALYWSGATSSTYPVDPDFTRNANFALDTVTGYIQRADSSWEYQDNNESGELIDSTIALVSGTAKYAITLTWLKITRVRVKDPNGNWVTLKPVSRRELSDAQLAATGTPWAYYKLGKYLYLVGTPNYSQTGGLEVQLQKGAQHFATDDTNEEPGFAPQFHRLVSLLSALDYTDTNEMERRSQKIRQRIGVFPEAGIIGSGMLLELAEFYSDRDKDGADHLSLAHEDHGASAMADGISSNPRGF